jgi:hypothetical protein
MAKTTFQGPVLSLNGFMSVGAGNVVNVAAAATLDPDTYAGRVIRTNAASMTLTLPAINASADAAAAGPGADPNSPNNVGASYTIFVETLASALKVIASGSDKFIGNVTITDANNVVLGFATVPASTVSINMNGTTKGGIVGSWVTFTALASAKWAVTGSLTGSGTIVTPFAAS